MTTILQKLDRRSFLRAGAASAGGLVLGFYLPERRAQAAETSTADTKADTKMNAYIHVAPDDTITFYIHKSEMGQGVVTSLSMLLAEELECDWNKIRTEFAGIDRAYGPLQGTFGSMSIRTSWDPLRKAGASAREMLVQAAAQKWGVDQSQCRAENNEVINTASNARLTYGSLAAAAAKLPVPANVALKDPKQFRLIGKPVKRLDTPGKVRGRTRFGLDMRLPGMQYAVLERCPVFGGKVASFDASKTKTVPGVKGVVQISNGVAVLADNTWAAMEGRRALQIQWDDGPNANATSASILQMFEGMAQKPGAVARKEGDANTALTGAAKKLEAVYEAPYLAHAPMEPMNCTAQVRPDGCDVWTGTQIQTAAHQAAMKITGLPADKVQIHTQYLGGGFGRRGSSDYVAEAVEIAKAVKTPVKLTWSREDDIQHDVYRPAAYAKFAGGLDSEGWPVAWTTRVACPPFGGIRNGIASTAVEGISDLMYGIPNIQVEYHPPDAGIPVDYWRSVGYSQNTFFTESFIDELAAAGGKDPVEFRRRLLAKAPRPLAVLEMAAEKAGWGKPLPAGRFQGIAIVNNVGSFNAQVAEISITNGKLRVHRVVCAMDCGQVVNPAILRQEVEGGIVYGLSAVKSAITIDKGRVQQQNFNNYEVLRIDDMPVVEVYIMPSQHAPGGIGEAAVPAIVPAVVNAVFAATGKRIRRLPIRTADLV